MGSRRGRPEQDKSRKVRITQSTLGRNMQDTTEGKEKKKDKERQPSRSKSDERVEGTEEAADLSVFPQVTRSSLFVRPVTVTI